MNDAAIYHITHVDNLNGIIGAGCVWCDEQRTARDLASTNIGYTHIKQRRMRRPVTVAAGGMLGGYVPFNFCPRSVMLYVISQGHEDYRGGQRPIVHLVSSIQSVLATGRPWFFTDRHADLGYATQIDSLDRLNEVDWSTMPVRQWGGDQELKEKRQAEFLVHESLPWTAVEAIGVLDEALAAQVRSILAGAAHRPRVEIHRDWYY